MGAKLNTMRAEKQLQSRVGENSLGVPQTCGEGKLKDYNKAVKELLEPVLLDDQIRYCGKHKLVAI